MDNSGSASWWWSSSPAAAHTVLRPDDDTANNQIRNLKRPRRTTSSWTGTKKHKNNSGAAAACLTAAAAPGGPSTTTSSRKRPYEYSEHELDVAIQKLYKCNYWEDPAYEKRLSYFGLLLARDAAVDNLCERVKRQCQAYMAARAQQHPAGASDGNNAPRLLSADYFTG